MLLGNHLDRADDEDDGNDGDGEGLRNPYCLQPLWGVGVKKECEAFQRPA
jgi:hypothetical protein